MLFLQFLMENVAHFFSLFFLIGSFPFDTFYVIIFLYLSSNGVVERMFYEEKSFSMKKKTALLFPTRLQRVNVLIRWSYSCLLLRLLLFFIRTINRSFLGIFAGFYVTLAVYSSPLVRFYDGIGNNNHEWENPTGKLIGKWLSRGKAKRQHIRIHVLSIHTVYM